MNSALDFLQNTFSFFPYKIHRVLTDNWLQFTHNALPKNKLPYKNIKITQKWLKYISPYEKVIEIFKKSPKIFKKNPEHYCVGLDN